MFEDLDDVFFLEFEMASKFLGTLQLTDRFLHANCQPTTLVAQFFFFFFDLGLEFTLKFQLSSGSFKSEP